MNEETYTVEFREKDMRRLINVLRFYVGDYRIITNVFDEDVYFLIDTLVEARGKDLAKQITSSEDRDE